jgi:hypothetical protein
MGQKSCILACSFGILLFAATHGRVAEAAVLAGNIAGGAPVLSPDGMFKVSLEPASVTSDVFPFLSELMLAQDKYGALYDINRSQMAAPGTFNVLQYQPFALRAGGGADLTVLYDDGVAAPRTDYNWVQFAHTTNWSDTKTTVDSLRSGSPFYGPLTPSHLPDALTGNISLKAQSPAIWNDATKYPSQHVQNPAGGPNNPAGDLFLVDEPYCSYTCLKGDTASSIMLDAFIVTFTAPKFGKNGKLTQKGTVTINDGFDYGVKMEKVPQVKPASNPQAPGNAQSNKASLDYDASSRHLTFSNEIMTGTGFVADPVIGAAIDIPALTLTGRSEGRFVFESEGSTAFTISSFLSAQLPVAYYVRSQNLFYGELTDFSFSGRGSPWIAELANLFDATSTDFDPNLALWVTISPNQPLFDVTGGFLLDGHVGDVKQIFAADAIPVPPPVPEPSSGWPLVSGAVALLLLPRRRLCSL